MKVPCALLVSDIFSKKNGQKLPMYLFSKIIMNICKKCLMKIVLNEAHSECFNCFRLPGDEKNEIWNQKGNVTNLENN